MMQYLCYLYKHDAVNIFYETCLPKQMAIMAFSGSN